MKTARHLRWTCCALGLLTLLAVVVGSPRTVAAAAQEYDASTFGDLRARPIGPAVRRMFLSDPFHSLKPRLDVSRVVLVLCRFCISVKNSPTCAGSTST